MKIWKKLISLLLVLAMIGGIAACSKDSDSDSGKSKKTKKTEKVKVSDDDEDDNDESGKDDKNDKDESTDASVESMVAAPAVEKVEPIDISTDMGVKVKIDGYLKVPKDAELEVTQLEEVADPEIGAHYTDYEITLGDVHEMGGYIELRLPYNEANIPAGQDPAKCVAAMYYDESAAEWVPVLYEVDTSAKEVVIHTNHFSTYRCFEFENEGQRMATVESIIDDLNILTYEEAKAAIEEFVADGEPGVYCRSVVAPIIESSFLEYVSAYEGGNELLSNIITSLCTTTISESAYNYMPNSDRVFAAVGKAGLYLAAATFMFYMTEDDRQDDDTMALYKEMAYKMSTSGMSLGDVCAGAWLVSDTINQSEQFTYNFVKESETRAYRYYMQLDDDSHCHLEMEDWNDIIYKIATSSLQSRDFDETNTIMDEIDGYCNEFWTLTESERAEIYAEVGQDDREDPDDQMKLEISNEYKGEILEQLWDILSGMEFQLKFNAMDTALQQLNNLSKYFNTKYNVEVVEVRDSTDSPRYAGCTVKFAPLSLAAEEEDWQMVLDSEGRADTTMTWIGYVLAGEPKTVEVYAETADPDDPPIMVKPFDINNPTVELVYEGITLNDLIGYYTGTYSIVNISVTDEGYEYMKANPGDLTDYDVDLSQVSKAECDAMLEQTMQENDMYKTVDLSSLTIEADTETATEGACFVTLYILQEDGGDKPLALMCTYSEGTFIINGTYFTKEEVAAAFGGNAEEVGEITFSGTLNAELDGTDIVVTSANIIMLATDLETGIAMEQVTFGVNVRKVQ